MSSPEDSLREIIEQHVFSRFEDAGDKRWIFDFRKVCMTKEFMDLYAEVFYKRFAGRDIQICGLESASIPLVTTLVYAAEKYGAHANGLFIRKGRKKYDLYKVIEGTPNGKPVVIVDDVLNTGKSVEKQIETLASEGLAVEAIFCLVRFRDLPFYDFLKKNGAELISLFEANDFQTSLGISNQESSKTLQPLPFTYKWGFKPPPPINYRSVVPKSAPIIYEDSILFGTDSGTFYCLNKRTGAPVWTHNVLFGDKAKRIFSSPIVHDGIVYFGSYDGNFYALDVKTGKKKWVYMDADWIGSSPCVSRQNGLVYIGLEFGLWKKRGGVAALDAKTGREVWRDTHASLTHCSPHVSDANNLLFCGSNDGTLRIYDATSGTLKKEHVLGEAMRASFSENSSHTKIAFGAFDKKCHIVDTSTLEITDSFETLEAIYSTPLWLGDNIIVNSLDKHIYMYDSIQKQLRWKFRTRGRIFSNPVVLNDALFTGSNDGVLYKIDLATGKEVGHLQFPERIVNKISFDEETGYTYIPLLNNELHCMVLEAKE